MLLDCQAFSPVMPASREAERGLERDGFETQRAQAERDPGAEGRPASKHGNANESTASFHIFNE